MDELTPGFPASNGGDDPASTIGLGAPSRDRREAGEVLVFGAFALRADDGRLERGGARIPLGDKAFQLLLYLAQRAGEVVGKHELLRHAGIEREDSLRYHIVAIRKALGEGRYIANVASQGYSFVAPVAAQRREPASILPTSTARPLPARPRRLVGRDAVLKAVTEQLFEHRFVSLIGPAGVGKTSVALTLAHDLKARFDGDVCVFDVGGVFNPDLLAAGVASVFEIPAPRGEAIGHVSSFGRRRMLLVLDGCEVSVDLTAALAERLFREGPEVHLLATSREALRAEGEHVHRMSPFPYPAVGEGQTAEDAQRFAAVQLFVDRVAASPSGFTLTDAEAPQVSEICRKLDGLALAIELAAGRVNAYGVADVARQLETEFVLMWPGRRSAVPRHHTLSAAFGWSHKRLSAAEQTAFRRLGVFAAAFTLDMATDALAGGLTPVAEARELLGSLVSKSLVQFNPEGRHGAYRLLVVTRSYALDRLAEADEIRQMSERHARLICRLVEADEPGAPAGEAPDAQDLFKDISAALEWSLSPDGDPGMAVSLTMASAPVWLRAGLLVECRYWIRRVLGAIGPPMLDDDRRLAIQSILGQAAARACAGAPRVNALE